jgi:hypothetical protein
MHNKPTAIADAKYPSSPWDVRELYIGPRSKDS